MNAAYPSVFIRSLTIISVLLVKCTGVSYRESRESQHQINDAEVDSCVIDVKDGLEKQLKTERDETRHSLPLATRRSILSNIIDLKKKKKTLLKTTGYKIVKFTIAGRARETFGSSVENNFDSRAEKIS